MRGGWRRDKTGRNPGKSREFANHLSYRALLGCMGGVITLAARPTADSRGNDSKNCKGKRKNQNKGKDPDTGWTFVVPAFIAKRGR
jgi:hypothetical protein